MTVPKFRHVFQLATIFFCIWHKHPDVCMCRASSSLFLPQSPLHSINIACVHLTLPPFWSSLAFFLQRINPFALLTCLFFLLILWRHSSDLIQSALTHSSVMLSHMDLAGLRLAWSWQPVSHPSIRFLFCQNYTKKRFGSKKKNHDSFTEIFIFNPMINTSHCSPYVHLTVDILWTV